MVPADWSKRKLSKVALTATGGTPNRKRLEYFGGNIPWVKSGELNDNWISRTEEHITLAGLENSSARLFPPGTLLIVLYGATVGKTALLNTEAATNQAICAVFSNTNLDIEYLRYYIIHIRPELLAQRYGGAQPNISQTILKNIEVALPPLPEQQRIAAVLSLVQRAIEQQERLIALTTELKKALMHKLFTEGIHGEPQKQTEIGPIPESWKIVELETTGEVVYGIQASVANNLEPIGTRILTNKNITLDCGFDLEKINYFVLKTKRHFATILQKGDLLFNWRSGSKHHVGKTAYFDLEGEWVHSLFILRIRPNPEINGRYLFHYFNHLRESEYFIKLQTYAINAKFNKSVVNSLPTVVPDREEQNQIAHTLDTAQRKIDEAESKKRILRDLFRTLLHQLMTADIRTNYLNTEELGLDSEK